MITIFIIEDLIEIQKGLKSVIEIDSRFKLLKSFENAESAFAQLPILNPDIFNLHTF